MLKKTKKTKRVYRIPANRIPEELKSFWDDEIAEQFQALKTDQKNFLIEFLKTGNGSEAYRRAYNPLAPANLCSAGSSRMLSNGNISLILNKFTEQKTQALFAVQKTFRDAMETATKPIFGKDDQGQPILVMDQPDHAVRVKAAEAVAKLHGLNQPAEVKHSGEVTSRILQINMPTRKMIDDDGPAN